MVDVIKITIISFGILIVILFLLAVYILFLAIICGSCRSNRVGLIVSNIVNTIFNGILLIGCDPEASFVFILLWIIGVISTVVVAIKYPGFDYDPM
jgi:hypothetical protein